MPRVIEGLVAAAPAVALAVAVACGGDEKKPAAAPAAGAGYADGDDLRVLSHDDCVALRDHEIDVVVADALADAGNDAALRLEIEARVRTEMKARTNEFVKKCAGSTISANDLRCMKEAATVPALLGCGSATDASAG